MEPEKKCNCPCHSPEFGGSYCTNLGVQICDKCGEPMEPEKKDVWDEDYENEKSKFLIYDRQSGSRWLNDETLKSFIKTHFIHRADLRAKIEEIEKDGLAVGLEKQSRDILNRILDLLTQ